MHSFIATIIAAAHIAAVVIGSVPFIRQETNFCGPAALTSVMSYYGDVIDQHEIAEVIYNEKLKGCIIADLENYARLKGYATKAGQGSVDLVLDFLNDRKPVIVLVDLGRWVISRPHYLVIVGYNEDGFIAHSGHEASQFYEFDRFKKIWKKIGSTYLVVYR
ncbi:MAG: C39 family peptidase [Syntrophales bacterium]|nr:C39 family peptidase [Syntrophales bacterium]